MTNPPQSQQVPSTPEAPQPVRRSGRGWAIAFMVLIAGMIVYGMIIALVVKPLRDSGDGNASQQSAPANNAP